MSSISGHSAAGSNRSASGYARRLMTSAGAVAGQGGAAAKATMEIHIDKHYRSKVYTSGTAVRGRVTVRAPPRDDVRFDAVQILLLGTTRTRSDGVNIPKATSHTFLRLCMPVPESQYPVPRVFEAGRSYDVPFNFVVPHNLTLNACKHTVANDAVRDCHTLPPPTVGAWDRDDLAPDMSRVEYAIKARVLRDDDSVAAAAGSSNHHHHNDKLLEASQEIKVLPTYPEAPPLSVTWYDRLYTMSKSKTLRRTILSPKLGKVTVSAAQPCAAMLSPDGHRSAGTTAELDVNFEPAATSGGASAAPPRVTAVTAKVTAVTYYSASGVRILPNLGDWDRSYGFEGSGSYSTTVSLPVPPEMPQITWTRRRPAAMLRADSGYGTGGEGPSDSEQTMRAVQEESAGSRSAAATTTTSATTTSGLTKTKTKDKTAAADPPAPYTGTLQIPIHLPTEKKTFLPTFHSCITSRVYVLNLTVSLSCGGTASSLALAVPLQVGVLEPSSATSTSSAASRAADYEPLLPPSFEADFEADADADQHLRPRIFAAPPDGGGAAALPGYADLVASSAAPYGRQVAAY